ncbi:MAG: flagellar basal body rod protein FlgC [Peptococcaceae bacterium]|nr:flagellar basal body rod protein FlgC [Peptococcaceae bacterium]
MGLFTAWDASASGLTAQRLRLDLITNNIANAATTRTGRTTAAGNQIPYQRQLPVFQSRDLESRSFSAFINRYSMSSPHSNGYILPSSTAGYLNSADGIVSSAGMAAGVKVTQIMRDPKPYTLAYEPDSPDAAQVEELGIPVGYVRYPNVDIVEEMIDMISATRAYEANVTALNASKTMASRALDIGR